MSRAARRRGPTRTTLSRELVVTEGLVTERQYLESLIQELPSSAATVEVKPVGGDPLQVLRKSQELQTAAAAKGKPYDWACCVVDVDEHSTLDACIETAREAGIHVVISNVKFEIWLLWHAMDKRGAQTTRELDQLVKKHSLMVGKHLAPRFPIANYPQAVKIAHQTDADLADRRRGPNPSSAMPILINLMTNPAAARPV